MVCVYVYSCVRFMYVCGLLVHLCSYGLHYMVGVYVYYVCL